MVSGTTSCTDDGMSLMRKRLVAASLSAVAGSFLITAPALASTPLPSSPCTIRVPGTINIGDPVTATVTTCPAGAMADAVYWSLEGPRDSTLNFSRDGSALYPHTNLTDSYGAYEPGTYKISPTASTSFCNEDYSECFEIPLLANTVVAKYRTTTALQVFRASSKGRWTTKLSTQVRRYDSSGYPSGAPRATVTVYRDNKALKTITTNFEGTVSITVSDTKGAHAYRASAATGNSTWPSASNTLRR
jgi:hypothetical protein